MKTFIHKTGALMLAVAFALAPVAPAVADHDPFNGVPQKSVQLCHSGNGTNFVDNSPSITATGGNINLAGHEGHDHDVIPPFHYDDNGTIISYPGKNWNASTQDLWDNGTCNGDGVVAKSVDLSITKVAGDTTPDQNQQITYTIHVANAGPDAATNVVVTDNIPAGTTFVSADNSGSGTGPVTWNIGTLNSGASIDLHVTVMVTAAAGVTVTNTASVTGTETDSNPQNNSVTEDVTVNTPVVVLGCTDPTATNYNPNATQGNPDAENCTYSAATGTLSVKKVIVGADVPYTNFSFAVNGLATTSFEADGQNDITKTVGTYTVTEAAAEGYTTTYDNCENVSVATGQVATCTITNTKIKTPPQNSCVLPSSDGDVEAFTINVGDGKTVQQILNEEGYSLNATTDQINTQTWNLNDGTADTVTLSVEVIGKYANNAQNFGYYTAGNAGSFVSIIANAQIGNTANVNVPASVAASMGFADKVGDGSITWYSQKALNTDGAKDHVAVYNPEANVYVVAFEDLSLGDKDHNDLVVKVTVVSCNNEDPTYTIDGYKWNDEDGDGNWDEGEDGLANWTINLLNDDTDAIVDSTTTDETGYYKFVVEKGNYRVEEVQQENWTQTAPSEVGYCAFEIGTPTLYSRVSRLIFLEDSATPDYSCDFGNHYTAPLCEVTVVSDETNTVDEKGGAAAKLVSFIHGAWTASIPGASWIWGDDPVVDPSVEETQTFTKTFVWDGPVTDAALVIASDNTYSVILNGNAVAADGAENNFGTADNYDVSDAVVQGTNTLKFTVTNKAAETINPLANPAGLLYKVTVSGTDETCGEVPPPPPDDGGGNDGGSSGGGKRISMSSDDGEVLGDSDEKPEPEVAGAQTAVLPAGAPNTGMGGAANTAAAATMLGSFVTMLAGVFALRKKNV